MKTAKPFTWVIAALSVLVPTLVALLYFLPKDGTLAWAGDLPLVNAIINGSTFLVLAAAWRAIRRKQILLHRRLMVIALGLSVIFLISYVIYHGTHPPTPYGGTGFLKGLYYFILLTHIILSAVIVPMVLVSLSRALSGNFERHRKIARITMPLWLYVALTGVLVYVMISPYYP